MSARVNRGPSPISAGCPDCAPQADLPAALSLVSEVPGTDIASTFALNGERYNIVQGCQRDTRPWRGYSEVLYCTPHFRGARRLGVAMFDRRDVLFASATA